MENIKINLNKIDIRQVESIANYLKAGKICVLPSDTSYALCARADNVDATNKIYQIKKREKNKSLTVFVKDIAMINNIAQVGSANKAILIKYLPGSYTFILKKKKNVLDNICVDRKTIGVRIIKSELIKAIFNFIKFPITATSANISGQAPIYNPIEIINNFQDRPLQPDLLVDAGSLIEITPSTLVDLTSNVPRILRQGKEKFQ